MDPKVSICIPTFNHAHFLNEAIESALSQTFKDLELLVVDNCSTDNTEEIVARYLKLDTRISYTRNESNIGLVGNLNRCLELAVGEYIKIMGADDLLEPSCIEQSLRIFDHNKNVSLVSCARILIDENSKPIGITAFGSKSILTSGTKVIKKCFFTANLIGEPIAVLFRKKDAFPGFNAKYKQLIDLDLWFRLLEKGDFAFLPDALCKFRIHANQTTKANVKSLSFISDEIALFHDYINKEYIGNSYINRQKWKFKVCYIIWTHKYQGLDIKVMRVKIREHYPLFIFYPILFLKLLPLIWHKFIKSLSTLLK